MDLVEDLIAERGLRPGDLLPSITELSRISGVSTISVRRGLAELEATGRVLRHQGVGTFVAGRPILSEPGRAGDLLATLTNGEGPPPVTTGLVDLKRGAPGAAIARSLRLGPGETVWELVRLRSIRRTPILLETAVIPVGLAPTLDTALLGSGGSLYGFLAERYGLVDHREEQYLEVGPPNDREARLLRLRRQDRLVRIRGVSFTRTGLPFDCFEQRYPSAGFVFYISGRTSRHLLRPADVRDWKVDPLGPGDVRVRGEPGSG